MIEKDFDLLRIIKHMRVFALQLRCLMDQSQASLSKQLAKHALSDDSNFSSSVSDSETGKSYEFLDKIFGDTEEKITKRLLKIFLSRNSKLKIKLQSESAIVLEHKVETDRPAQKDKVVNFGYLNRKISNNYDDNSLEWKGELVDEEDS